MKKLILPLLVMTLALGSCNMANDDDYKNLAKDLCNCMNANGKKVSPEMTKALVDAANNGKDIETVLSDAITKDPIKGMEDYNAVMKVLSGVQKCADDLEKKYNDIYTNDDDAEMQRKVLEIFKNDKGCDLTYAIWKMSMEEGK